MKNYLLIIGILLFSTAFGQLTISGDTAGCVGVTYTYKLSTGTTPPDKDTWTWKLPTGATLGKDCFTWSASKPGTYKLQAVLKSEHPLPHDVLIKESPSNIITVVIDAVPVLPSAIRGNFQPCGLTTQLYSIDPISNADSYTWQLAKGMYTLKKDNLYDTRIEFIDGVPQSGTLMVRGSNECGDGDYQLAVVTLNQVPAPETVISGPSNVCEHTPGYNYSVPKTDDIKDYCWTCEHDGVFHTTPSVNTVSIDVGIDSTAKVSPYNRTFKVRLDNQCGSTVISKTVAITKIPLKPSKIQGDKFDITDLTVNYIFTTSSDYSEKVIWTITPSNAGNQIFDKSGNNDSLILNINKSYTGQIKIVALGSNSCGTSLASTEAFIQILPKPEKCTKPDGDINVCVNKNNTYTTTCNFADTYEWELTPSTAGKITVNLDKSEIDWDDNYNGAASLRVRGKNASGDGEWSNYINIVVYSLPTKPITPSGDLVLCVNSASTEYTTATSFATSYEWEINPTTAGVIFNNNQKAVVNWENTYTGKAYLRVRGVNTCGVGEWSEFQIITISTQAQQPSISGNFQPCAGETVVYTAATSDSVIWSIEPPNAYKSFKVLSKNQLEVTWNRDNLISSSAAIKTYSISNCGTSTIKTDSVYINRFSTTGTAPTLLSTIKPFYCSSDSVEIIFSNTNQLLWFSNNQLIATGFKNTINFKSGIKEIKVTSILPNNCYSTSKTVNFNVDNLKADFTTNTTQINVGGQVEFKNLSVGANSFEWDFGDNSFNSTNKDDYHNYYVKGIYTVKLTVLSSNKCSDVLIKNKLINVGADGIEEFTEEELSVYPNPVLDKVFIQASFTEKYNVCLTDISGKTIIENKANAKELNLEPLAKGVYFLKIESAEKSKIYKLIK